MHRPKYHRSKYEIVNEILKVVLSRSQSPSSFYKCRHIHIAYGAGMTYSQLLDYLPQLTGSGLLKMTKVGPDRYYEVSDKGQHYLHIYAEIEEDLYPDPV
jgi:predicted transcriptional regulator